MAFIKKREYIKTYLNIHFDALSSKLLFAILFLSTHNNYTIPIVLTIRLLIRTLPLDRDLI